MIRNNCDVTHIVTSKPKKNQYPCGYGKQSPDGCGKQAEFRRFYRDRRLTDCLEIVEECGFQGDNAIFILAVMGGEA